MFVKIGWSKTKWQIDLMRNFVLLLSLMKVDFLTEILNETKINTYLNIC